VRAFRATLLALPLLAATVAPALAQKYPSRPIRVLLPFAAGSVSDITTRILADKLSARMGASVIVDDQPRAGGVTVGTSTMTSPPDGYTVAVFSTSTAISVSLLKSLPYDPLQDFAAVSGQSTFANILATNSGSKYHTLGDVIAAAKANPGKLNIGTTTVGSTNYLAATLLRSMTGLDFVIVPFRTPGELVTAVIRNDVDVIVQSWGALKSAIGDGQLRALASTTPTRAPYAPDVPTVDESGVKGFDVVTWNGIFAPAKTPPDIIDTLNAAMRAALTDPELRQRYLQLGLEPTPSTPAEAHARIAGEIEKYAQIIKDAGIEKQ
jgi:tripartite-type tricarboxylate transporter receptor subunit TctC